MTRGVFVLALLVAVLVCARAAADSGDNEEPTSAAMPGSTPTPTPTQETKPNGFRKSFHGLLGMFHDIQHVLHSPGQAKEQLDHIEGELKELKEHEKSSEEKADELVRLRSKHPGRWTTHDHLHLQKARAQSDYLKNLRALRKMRADRRVHLNDVLPRYHAHPDDVKLASEVRQLEQQINSWRIQEEREKLLEGSHKSVLAKIEADKRRELVQATRTEKTARAQLEREISANRRMSNELRAELARERNLMNEMRRQHNVDVKAWGREASARQREIAQLDSLERREGDELAHDMREHSRAEGMADAAVHTSVAGAVVLGLAAAVLAMNV